MNEEPQTPLSPERARRTEHDNAPETPPAPATDVDYRCDLCGAPMLEWHCRIICNYCGYQRDCSDP